MSYLTPPRLTFAGRFQVDVSTVNNDPEHFDVANFRSSSWRTGEGPVDGWWNPSGTNAFRLVDAIVRSATASTGELSTDSAFDGAIGMGVRDADHRVPGRMVDLDPDNQLVPAVWGWRIEITDVTGRPVLAGSYEPSSMMEMWLRVAGGVPDSGFAAAYQSVLTDLEWGDTSGSDVLDELHRDSPDRLSMRFVLDGVDDDPTSPTVTIGRIIGAIGRHDPTEPHGFVAARHLDPSLTPLSDPSATPPHVNSCVVAIDGTTAWIDLSNSLPTSSPGGPLVDVGNLRLAVAGAGPGDPPTLLGTIQYQSDDWLESTAGIVGIEIGDHAQDERPLQVIGSTGVVLTEPDDGLWLRFDQNTFRFDPGQQQTARLYARRFGRPAPGVDVALAFDSSLLDAQTVIDPRRPGPRLVGQPTTAVDVPSQVTTGDDGTADVTIAASDPGLPRDYIDGQVYQVVYRAGPTPPPAGSVVEPSRMLNLRVFSGTDVPARPSWVRDVGPIFQQYAALFPVMKPIIDLANYGEVASKARLVEFALSADITDPRYMPVTRDLSSAKRSMLLSWLAAPILFDRADPVDLRRALQVAIELEHATLPPYLTALFSIKPGSNRHIALLLNSVVREEMGHLVMAANILVAIGGSPQIGRHGFTPRYPGPIPGGIGDHTTLRLRRLSYSQIRDLFLTIERPGVVAETVAHQLSPGVSSYRESQTIDELYTAIADSIRMLSESGAITFGRTDHQVTEWLGGQRLAPVTSCDDALAQIETIRHEGAGVGPRDPRASEGERLGHYYRFAEILEGRTLVHDGESWAFRGDEIPLDESGIWPMVDDPDLESFPAGSRAAVEAASFRASYQALLDQLHVAFNGRPAAIGDAIAAMHSVGILGRRLASMPIGDGLTAGPVF
jgi:hypothetical protein